MSYSENGYDVINYLVDLKSSVQYSIRTKFHCFKLQIAELN